MKADRVSGYMWSQLVTSVTISYCLLCFPALPKRRHFGRFSNSLELYDDACFSVVMRRYIILM